MLKQNKNSPVRAGCQIIIIYAVTHGFLDKIEVSDVSKFEDKLILKAESEYLPLLERLEKGSFDDNDIAEIEKLIKETE